MLTRTWAAPSMPSARARPCHARTSRRKRRIRLMRATRQASCARHSATPQHTPTPATMTRRRTTTSQTEGIEPTACPVRLPRMPAQRCMRAEGAFSAYCLRSTSFVFPVLFCCPSARHIRAMSGTLDLINILHPEPRTRASILCTFIENSTRVICIYQKKINTKQRLLPVAMYNVSSRIPRNGPQHDR